MNFFPLPEDEKTVMFEKSATYFTNPLVPKRLSALLPNKHIIVVLTNPADRAYSWYQVKGGYVIKSSFYRYLHNQLKHSIS